MKAYCAILAGGTGTRMGGDIPKQFLSIGGQPIIVWTLKRVLSCKKIERIVVAVHKDWETRLLEMLSTAGIDMERVIVTLGGRERHDSIHNALKAIHNYLPVNEDDVVVIHDAVRPFVSTRILEDSIKAAAVYGACVATIPAVDTMLKVESGAVVAVPPRSTLYHGQAPDSARILILERALESLTDDERKTITGTAQILVVKGFPVKAIQGDSRNIKITTPADMEIAERILMECNK